MDINEIFENEIFPQLTWDVFPDKETFIVSDIITIFDIKDPQNFIKLKNYMNENVHSAYRLKLFDNWFEVHHDTDESFSLRVNINKDNLKTLVSHMKSIKNINNIDEILAAAELLKTLPLEFL